MKFAQSSAVYFNYTLQYAIRDLHALGYDGIEIWGGRPHMYRHDLDSQFDEITGLLRACGMNVCNFIPAQFRYPSLLCSDNEYVRTESVEYIKSAIDNAVRIGSPSVSLCPGMVPFDKDVRHGWDSLKRSFNEILEYVEGKAITLLIEPAHRFESNLILTIDDCLRMIDELGFGRFGILLDTGHCRINGELFREIIPRCTEHPFHIHIDDNTGQADAHMIPGHGDIDFYSLADALASIRYNGFLSAELGASYNMDPTPACRETLASLRKFFKK